MGDTRTRYGGGFTLIVHHYTSDINMRPLLAGPSSSIIGTVEEDAGIFLLFYALLTNDRPQGVSLVVLAKAWADYYHPHTIEMGSRWNSFDPSPSLALVRGRRLRG